MGIRLNFWGFLRVASSINLSVVADSVSFSFITTSVTVVQGKSFCLSVKAGWKL